MSETLRVSIDSSGAKRGSDAFISAVRAMGTAVNNLDRSTATITKLNNAMGKLDFSRLARGLASLNGVVNSTTITNMSRLSTTMQNMKVPTATQVNNIRGFSAALSTIRVPPGNLQGLVSLLGSISRFNPPNATTTANLQAFGTALRSISTTGTTTALRATTTEMNALANATLRAAAAFRQLGAAQGRIRASVAPAVQSAASSSSSFIGGGLSYTPRRPQGIQTSAGRFDGVFSGHTRATGSLRGAENVINPAYQGASVARTAIGAITLGSFVKDIYETGKAFTAVQHMMEVMATSAAEVDSWFKRISDIADKFGQDLQSMRRGFAVFTISASQSGWTKEQAMVTYSNMASVIRAVGLTPKQSEHVYETADAALSSGALTATHLHRMLAPLIPGVTATMARLVHNYEKKLPLQTPLTDPAEVAAAESRLTQITRKRELSGNALAVLFQELARELRKGLPTAVNSPQAQEARMKNEWTVTKERMDTLTGPALGKLWEQIANMLKNPQVVNFFQKVAEGMVDAIKAIQSGLLFLTRNITEVTTALKLLFALGAAEVLLRLGGAFSSVTALVGLMTAPIVRATGALGAFLAMSGKVAAQGGILAISGAARGSVAVASGVAAAAGAGVSAIGSRGAATNAALSARVASLSGPTVGAAAGVAAGAATAATTAATNGTNIATAATRLWAGAVTSVGYAYTGLATAFSVAQSALLVGVRILMGALTVGLVGAIAAVYTAWDTADSKGYTVSEYFSQAVRDLGKGILDVANSIRNTFVSAIDVMTGASNSGTEQWKGDINDWGMAAITTIEVVKAAFRGLWDIGSAVINGLVAIVTSGPIAKIAGGASAGALVGGRFGGGYGAAAGALIGGAGAYFGSSNEPDPAGEANRRIAAAAGNLGDTLVRVTNEVRAAMGGQTLPTQRAGIDRQKALLQRQNMGEQYGPIPFNGVKEVTEVPGLSNAKGAPGLSMLQPGHGSHGGGGGGGGTSPYDRLRASVSEYDKVLMELQKDQMILNAEMASGRITAEEYARIQESIKSKMLESIGIMNPAAKATERLRDAVGALNALEKAGLITTEQKAKYLQTVGAIYEKAAKPVEHFLKLMGQEIGLLQLGSREREVQSRLQTEINRMREQGYEPNSSEVAQMKQMLEIEQKMKDVAQDREAGLQHWANGFRSLYTELAKLEEKLADDMSNAMADFITTGKTDFKSMIDSWYKDIMRLVTRDVFRTLLQGMGLIGETGSSATGNSLLGGAMGLASPAQRAQTLTGGMMSMLTSNGASPQTVAAVGAGDMSMLGGGTLAAMLAAQAAASGNVSDPRTKKTLQQAAYPVANGVNNGLPIPPVPPMADSSFSFDDTSGFDGAIIDLVSSMPIPPIPPAGGVGNTISGIQPGSYGLYNPTMLPAEAQKAGLASMAMGGIGSLFSGGSGGGNFLTGNASSSGGGGLMGALFGKSGANMFGLTDPQGAFMQNGGLLGYLTGGLGAGMKDGGGYGLFNDIASLFGGGSAVAANSGSALEALIESGTMTSSVASESIASGLFSGAASSGGGIFGWLSSLFTGLFSEGGYSTNAVRMGMMPAYAFANAPHYAQGTSNTSFGAGGMPAVVHPNEAIIPLSRGRSIPVDLGERGGQNQSVNVTMNIQTPDANSFRQSQGQIYKDAGASLTRHMRRN